MKQQVTLFYDVETSGLIKDHKLPSEHPSHPHITQLSAILRDDEGRVLGRLSQCIQPDGWALDAGIQAFNARTGNGITQDRLEREGVPIGNAMAAFFLMFTQAQLVVQWDKYFLARMIRIEAKRLGMEAHAEAFKAFTNNVSLNSAVAPIVPGQYGKTGFKKPSLPEAHMFFMGQAMPITNNAQIDCEAIMGIFDKATAYPCFAWPSEAKKEAA